MPKTFYGREMSNKETLVEELSRVMVEKNHLKNENKILRSLLSKITFDIPFIIDRLTSISDFSEEEINTLNALHKSKNF